MRGHLAEQSSFEILARLMRIQREYNRTGIPLPHLHNMCTTPTLTLGWLVEKFIAIAWSHGCSVLAELCNLAGRKVLEGEVCKAFYGIAAVVLLYCLPSHSLLSRQNVFEAELLEEVPGRMGQGGYNVNRGQHRACQQPKGFHQPAPVSFKVAAQERPSLCLLAAAMLLLPRLAEYSQRLAQIRVRKW
jgi:hypothetical protein